MPQKYLLKKRKKMSCRAEPGVGCPPTKERKNERSPKPQERADPHPRNSPRRGSDDAREVAAPGSTAGNWWSAGERPSSPGALTCSDGGESARGQRLTGITDGQLARRC